MSSVKELNRQNPCFDDLLYTLSGIVGNLKLSWEEKNLLFQETFKKFIPNLPQNKVPSFLFEADYNYQDSVLMQDLE